LTRSAMGLISAFLCIDALRLLPLSEATCFFYTAPLLTTLLSAFLLKEKVTLTKGLAVLAGFLGVLYMMQPQVSDSLTGAFIALGSALFSGFVAIELRRLSESEKSITIVCYFMTACTIAGLLTMPFQFTMPNLQDAVILVLVGITGGIAQMFMTDAYKYAPASTVAPLNYFSLLWATTLDAVLFGKFPVLTTLVGAIVVAASGIFVVRPSKTQK
jgi:EamA-like transporter family.